MGPGSAEYAGGLYHHRGGLSRLRPGQSADRGPQHPGVLLIEAGGRDWNPLIHIPAGFFKMLDHDTLTWKFRSELDPAPQRPRHRLHTRPGVRRVIVDQRVDLHPRPAKGRIAAKNGTIAKAGGVELSTRHHAEILETLRQLISTPDIAIDAIM